MERLALPTTLKSVKDSENGRRVRHSMNEFAKSVFVNVTDELEVYPDCFTAKETAMLKALAELSRAISFETED